MRRTGVADRAGAPRQKLVVLNPERSLDVPLYGQHAAVRSTVLDNVGAALREAPRQALRA